MTSGEKGSVLQLARPLSSTPGGKPLAIDLFCGAGGMTIGLKQAGFAVVGAIDIDPVAVATYRKNHRKSAVWQGDIRQLEPSEVMDQLALKPGQLDLLAGCPPCQGFSRIRTRNRSTVRDARNELIDEFVRLAIELKPKAIMMENVPRLGKYPRLTTMVRKLRAEGYHVDHGIVDAAGFGVPQRRKRFIVLGSKNQGLAVPESDGERRTVRDAIGHLDQPVQLQHKDGRPIYVHKHDKWSELHALPPKRDPQVIARIKQIPIDGGSRTDLPDDAQLECHRKSDGFKDVYGRMVWDDVSPTITGGCINPSKGRFLHPQQHRAITLREAALLQTFPPDYKFSLENGTYVAATMIGNALPPELIRRIGSCVRKHLDGVVTAGREDPSNGFP